MESGAGGAPPAGRGHSGSGCDGGRRGAAGGTPRRASRRAVSRPGRACATGSGAAEAGTARPRAGASRGRAAENAGAGRPEEAQGARAAGSGAEASAGETRSEGRAAPSPDASPPPRREETYDDVLAGLRAERGEVRPTRADRAGVQTASAAGVSGATGTTGARVAGTGERIDAEVAVWLRAAKYHVEQAWIMPPGFEREPLRTVVRVRLDAGGRVLGEPRVQQRSGNPWFDESVVRAIQKANPLPPPPDAGDWPFEFTPPGSSG